MVAAVVVLVVVAATEAAIKLPHQSCNNISTKTWAGPRAGTADKEKMDST